MCALLSGQAPTLELIVRQYAPDQRLIDLRLGGLLLTRQIFRGHSPILTLDREALLVSKLDSQAYGEQLSAMLYQDRRVADGLREALIIAEQAEQPLRLRLCLDPDDAFAQNIAWELLREPEGSNYLSAMERLCFTRSYASRHNAPLMRRPRGELSAVIAVASPLNLPEFDMTPIDVEAELAGAQAALGPIRVIQAAHPDHGERTTRERLLTALAQLPDILLLICHGSFSHVGERPEPILWLEDTQGMAQRLSGGELITALASISRWPTLIVLVACDTAGNEDEVTALEALGPRMVEAGCPAVIAARGKLSLATAGEFFRTFFTTLHRDGQIERALAYARNICRQHDDWWRPTLYSRLEDGLIWQPTPERRVFSGVPDPPATFVGRTDEVKALREALLSREPEPPIAMVTGASGLGKTSLVAWTIAQLRREGLISEIVLWGNLGGHHPQELLAAFLADLGLGLGTDQEQTQAHTLTQLRELLWERLKKDRRSFVLVLDNVASAEQLRLIVPEDPPASCRLVIVGQAQLPAAFRRATNPICVSPLTAGQINEVFSAILAPQTLTRSYEALLARMQQLGGHTHLVVATALYLKQSGERPDEYLARLGEDDLLVGDASLWAWFDQSMRDLSAEQRRVFALVALFGEESWSPELTAACLLRPLDEVQAILRALAERSLLSLDEGQRYRANGIARALAARLLYELPAYERGQLTYLFTRSCLDRMTDQVTAQPELGAGGTMSDAVRRFRAELAHELPHLRKALVFAEQYPDWRLLPRFARCSRLEIVAELVCNAPDVRITLMLAHLHRPIFWADGTEVRVKAAEVILSHEMSMRCAKAGKGPPPLLVNDAECYADGLAWPPVTKPIIRPNHAELSLTLTASRLSNGIIRGYTLVSSRWSGVEAAGLILVDVDMIGVKWSHCDLQRNVWVQCDARRAELMRCSLTQARLEQVNLRDGNLSGLDLRGADLHKVDLRGADLSGASLQGARLHEVDLRGANLRRTRFDGATLKEVQLEDCRHEGSSWRGVIGQPTTSDTALTARIRDEQGELPRGDALPLILTPVSTIVERPDGDYASVDLRAAQRPGLEINLPPPRRLSLEYADLSAVHLSGAKLPRVALKGACLAASDLRAATLSDADMTGADLYGACLEEAILYNTQLSGASLQFARLGKANLRGADLRGADLRRALVRPDRLATAADLRGAIVPYRREGWIVEEWRGHRSGTPYTADLPVRYNTFSGIFPEIAFEGCDLLGAVLSGYFWHCTFINAQMRLARIAGTFSQGSFAGARLCGAKLNGIFDQVTFSGADLRGAIISGVIVNTSLAGCNLAGTDLSGAALVNVDLRDCSGLTQAQLRQADSLRGSIVPANLPGAGELHLRGDREAARRSGIDLDNHAALVAFCARQADVDDLLSQRRAG